MGEMRNACNILIGEHQRKRSFVGLGVDGGKILKLALDNSVSRMEWIWVSQAESYTTGELSGFINQDISL